MIKVKMTDSEGHGYWLYEDGQFVLALKNKPTAGVQFKTKGWLRKGILSLHDLPWNERGKCWHMFRFPLIKTKSFGIRMVYIEGFDEKGNVKKGWVHPRVLTGREDTYHPTGYEKQVKIFPKDLHKTFDEAIRAWERI